MLPTISYYNGVSNLHRHESMDGQFDRTSSKNFPSSNADIDLVLEKQREPIVGLVIEDVFVLPSEFQAMLTIDQAEGENERPITIHGFSPVRSSNLVDPEESCNTTVHADAEFSGDSTNDQVQSAINEGRLKFAENPQMKLDEDPLQVNMNMVELEGKKVLVWPSQTESTEGKKVIIGEERQPRMIRPKIPKMADGRRTIEASHDLVQKSPSTSSWLNIEVARPVSRIVKAGPSGFPGLGEYFCDRKLIQQPI
jgi:hypothetical protein